MRDIQLTYHQTRELTSPSAWEWIIGLCTYAKQRQIVQERLEALMRKVRVLDERMAEIELYMGNLNTNYDDESTHIFGGCCACSPGKGKNRP